MTVEPTWLRWKEGKMIGEGTFVRPDGTPLLFLYKYSGDDE